MIKTAAIVTIKGPGKMSARGRKQIAAWMRRQAASLERHGRKYTTGDFRARWQYTNEF